MIAPALSASSTPSARFLLLLQGQLFREVRSGRRDQLMTWLLDRRNIEAAWERVRQADGASTPGCDGVTCDQLQGQIGPWLTRLTDQLFHDRYRPSPVRWIEVPKPNRPGKMRRLGILTIQDRVVHAAFKNLLEPIFDPFFHPDSFGFRPGRSVPGALEQATRLLTATPDDRNGFACAAALDVADCFDTIDLQTLLGCLRRHLADAQVLRLLEILLEPAAVTVGFWWWKRRRGIVQGSSLSPLLCNLVLHEVDREIHQLARNHQGGVRLLRYADDLLLLARDQRLAQRGVQAVHQCLRRLRLSLRQSAPEIRPCRRGIDWLGVRLPRPLALSGQTTFGYVVPETKVQDMARRLAEMTTPPSDRIDASAFNLGRWLVSLNDQLRDWRQAYLFADNAPQVFQALDGFLDHRVGELLHAVTGVRRGGLLRRHRVRLPRGFSTWQVDGVRLVVLSSLAPHHPHFLTRKPAWMRSAKEENRAAAARLPVEDLDPAHDSAAEEALAEEALAEPAAPPPASPSSIVPATTEPTP